MKKIIVIIACLVSMIASNPYIVSSNVITSRQQGYILECDSNSSSSIIDIRDNSRMQLTITGIDSATVIVTLYVGRKDFINSIFWNANSTRDTTKLATDIDTITVNGVYDFSDYMGTGLKVSSTKKDNGVKVFINLSTY
jgi:hypothetical protein